MSDFWRLSQFFSLLLLPPANGLLLAGLGLLLWRRFRKLGRPLLIGGGALIWLSSLHVVSALLAVPMERSFAPLAPEQLRSAGAVVVLGGGRDRLAPEYAGDDDLAAASLRRLRYAATLARTGNLPLLLAGGRPDGGQLAEAEAMQRVLARDFAFQARWLENTSRTTRENARNAAPLLKAAGIEQVVLVTHALHMPRAVREFQAAGVRVIPAPMGYLSARPWTALDWLPRGEAVAESAAVWHEYLGMLWYALKS